MGSDLAGDSMRLSGSGSPTVSPFKLDAMICTETAIQVKIALAEGFNSEWAMLAASDKHALESQMKTEIESQFDS